MSIEVLITLILFNIMHWLADYTPLSTMWMLKAKQYGKPILPILAHGGVNGLFYGIVGLIMTQSLLISLIVFFIETITHTIFDVLKGRINVWFPIAEDKMKHPYWVIMGADQLCHQIVLVSITYLMFNL